MIESIKIDIGLGTRTDCCCPFIRNKEPFKRALISIDVTAGLLYLPQYVHIYSDTLVRPLS